MQIQYNVRDDVTDLVSDIRPSIADISIHLAHDTDMFITI